MTGSRTVSPWTVVIALAPLLTTYLESSSGSLGSSFRASGEVLFFTGGVRSFALSDVSLHPIVFRVFSQSFTRHSGSTGSFSTDSGFSSTSLHQFLVDSFTNAKMC